MKRITTIILIILLVLSIPLHLTSCSQTVKKYLFVINEKAEESSVALIRFTNGECIGNLLQFRNNAIEIYGLHQEPIALYNSHVYFLKQDTQDYMCIAIYNLDGELTETIDLGAFDTNQNNSYRYQEWSSFYDEWYHDPLMHDQENNFEYQQSIYRNSVTSRYANGCIYVKDARHCLKYNIKEQTLTENPEEAEDIFVIHYTYNRSPDNQSLFIHRIEDGTLREVTFESIAKTCPEIQEIINRYGNKKVFLENNVYTDMPFWMPDEGYFLREFGGDLYITVHLRNYWGDFLPIILKMDFDTENFTFCVAGDNRCNATAIPILK